MFRRRRRRRRAPSPKSPPIMRDDEDADLDELLSLCIPTYEGPDVDLLIELMQLCNVSSSPTRQSVWGRTSFLAVVLSSIVINQSSIADVVRRRRRMITFRMRRPLKGPMSQDAYVTHLERTPVEHRVFTPMTRDAMSLADIRRIIEASWTSCEKDGLAAIVGTSPPRLLTPHGGDMRIVAVWFRDRDFGAVPVGERDMVRMQDLKLRSMTSIDAFFLMRSMSSVSRELTWKTMDSRATGESPGTGSRMIRMSDDEDVMVEMETETPWMHLELLRKEP